MSDVFLFWLAAFMLMVAGIDRPDRADLYAKICYGLAALAALNGVLT